jgi:hypothetical protein
MKIYYMNDESRAINVHLIGTNLNEIEILMPQEGKVFDIPCPDNSTPYIKKWDYAVVLLSFVLPENLPPLQAHALPKD